MKPDSISPPMAIGSGYPVLPRDYAVPPRYPLWLWWNLLSLDAPSVAFLWSLLFMRALQIPTHDWEIVELVFALWIIYAGARILDGWKTPPSATLPERHV